MSTYAWVILIVGVVVLAVALFAVVTGGSVSASAAKPEPANWANTTEAAVWQERLDLAQADFGLADVRDVASKWTGSIAGLLGVLSSVAFVAGPSDLVKDVGGWEAQLAAWIVLAAAALAAVGLAFAVVAEQGSPKWDPKVDAWSYRWQRKELAKRSADRIRTSRYLILAAVVLIIVATGIAWMKALTKPSSSEQDAIVSFVSGAVCGPLTTHNGIVSITVNGSERAVRNARITLVSSCP